jgi:hypothetical protein
VCGAEGIVPVRGATPPAVPPAVPSATPPPTGTSPVRAVRLKCPRCQAVTSVADTGARPLRARCSGCGAALGLR